MTGNDSGNDLTDISAPQHAPKMPLPPNDTEANGMVIMQRRLMQAYGRQVAKLFKEIVDSVIKASE